MHHFKVYEEGNYFFSGKGFNMIGQLTLANTVQSTSVHDIIAGETDAQ